MKFSELNLLPEIQKAIAEFGYETPTDIQAQAIPHVLQKRDLIGSAQTGTGKTAAFCLPALSLLKAHSGAAPRCLILEPTRELAAQVDENLSIYTRYSDLTTVLLHGGVGYGKQLDALEQGVDIIVATPGRLLDHLSQKTLSLASIELLILDEVDRMLDMGFIEDVQRIIHQCSDQRQTLLFSATVPDAIRTLADWALTDPEVIDVGGNRTPAETVDHAIFPVDGIQKYDLLLAMLEKMDYKSVIIFSRTKIDADRIARWLIDHNHAVTVMHADRTQKDRQKALKGFKSGEYAIMVATDIASRGLDISGVSHVINYNVPQHAEDYVHRIGRTGRASSEGEAFTLFSSDEANYLELVEKYIDQTIPKRKLEGFRYRTEPNLSSENKKVIRKRRNR